MGKKCQNANICFTSVCEVLYKGEMNKPDKLRLIADLIENPRPFEVKTEHGTWVTPSEALPDSFVEDCWEIRIKPGSATFEAHGKTWKLPDPPAGRQWHRTDWTEEMLPEGWRPLLLRENEEQMDEFLHPDGKWHSGPSTGGASSHNFHRRTRRPLPEETVMAPLGPEDVPPGSVIRSNDRHRFAVTKMSITYGLWIDALHRRNEIIWSELAEHWQIKRPGQDWQPCSKPAK